MNKSQIEYMTEALFEAYFTGVYDKELKRGRDVWEKSAIEHLKKLEKKKTKVIVTKHKDRKSRPSKKAIEKWIKNGNVIIVEDENIEHF